MGKTNTFFTHPSSIKEALQDSSILHDKAFVGGEWVGSNSTFPVYDPATDKVIANVASHY
jgi:succinate-semialdehyde dehydrogenase / glutarate-semialdehyde dehydrogenase